MDLADEYKAVLRPAKPGEALKVAETVLRRRDRNLKAAQKRAEKYQKVKVIKKTHINFNVKSAAKMLQGRRLMRQEKGRLKTIAKKAVPKVTKGRSVLVVIRNARSGGSPDAKDKLRELGLSGKNRGVFVRNQSSTLSDLRIIEPFCFWGPPTLQAVTDLLYKKAYVQGDEDEPVVPLQDNRIIEEKLGDAGLLCVEDLVDAVYNGTEAFERVRELLLPMQFGDERETKGLTKEIRHLFGNQKKNIDQTLGSLLGSAK